MMVPMVFNLVVWPVRLDKPVGGKPTGARLLKHNTDNENTASSKNKIQ